MAIDPTKQQIIYLIQEESRIPVSKDKLAACSSVISAMFSQPWRESCGEVKFDGLSAKNGLRVKNFIDRGIFPNVFAMKSREKSELHTWADMYDVQDFISNRHLFRARWYQSVVSGDRTTLDHLLELLKKRFPGIKMEMKGGDTLDLSWNITALRAGTALEILSYTPSLTGLDLGGNPLITDDCLSFIGDLCPTLESISLRGLHDITTKGVDSLLLKCKKLNKESIDLSLTILSL